MAKRKSAALIRAEKAGHEAIDLGFRRLRSAAMRSLRELPDDGTADRDRAEIISFLEAVNSHTGFVGEDDTEDA